MYLSPFEEYFNAVREESIKSVSENGSAENKDRLQAFLELEKRTGERMPTMMFRRLSNEWVREHTKAYQTPTILRDWKAETPTMLRRPRLIVYIVPLSKETK